MNTPHSPHITIRVRLAPPDHKAAKHYAVEHGLTWDMLITTALRKLTGEDARPETAPEPASAPPSCADVDADDLVESLTGEASR